MSVIFVAMENRPYLLRGPASPTPNIPRTIDVMRHGWAWSGASFGKRCPMPHRALHPGKVLADELASIGISPTELARQIDVPPNRISQIINCKRAITGDTAIRLAHWFGTRPDFWLNLQSAYDLHRAQKHFDSSVRHLPTKAQFISQSVPSRAKAVT